MADSAANPNDEATQASLNKERILSIPEHLRIKVLYEDEAVIVILKPSNLRSVPGHASPPPTSQDSNEEERRMTAQEAWVSAIRGFRDEEVSDTAGKWLKNLAVATNLSSVPRKWGPFRRYCQRNQQRLAIETTNQGHDKDRSNLKRRVNDTELDAIARKMHECIKKRQLPSLNLPEATDHEESAFGQLILLGYVDEEATVEESGDCCRRLYVVHRLDCEVSVGPYVYVGRFLCRITQ